VNHIVIGAAIAALLATAPVTVAAQAQPTQAPRHLLSGDVVAPQFAAAAAPFAASSPAIAGEALWQDGRRSFKWEGLLIGAVGGAILTHVFTHQGGSTSLCDRDRNQDAIRANECAAITAAGGVVFGGIGFAIGSRIRR
jgi:hypothetical protein